MRPSTPSTPLTLLFHYYYFIESVVILEYGKRKDQKRLQLSVLPSPPPFASRADWETNKSIKYKVFGLYYLSVFSAQFDLFDSISSISKSWNGGGYMTSSRRPGLYTYRPNAA